MCFLLLGRCFWRLTWGWSCSSCRWRRSLHRLRSAKECLGCTSDRHCFSRRVVIAVLRTGWSFAPDSRHPKIFHVDDSLTASNLLKEVQHGEIWSVDFNIERHFGVVLLRGYWLGDVTANLDSSLLRIRLQVADELVGALIVGNNLFLALHLPLQRVNLQLDCFKLPFVWLQSSVIGLLRLQSLH